MKRFFFLVIGGVFFMPLFSFAYPYYPGETLQPTCSPTTTGCTVKTTEIARAGGAPGLAVNPVDATDPVVYVDETNGDLYTWDGSQWNMVSGGGSGWSLTGNSGITNSHFIGTTNAADFIFKVNNGEIARFGQSSNLALLNYNDGSLIGADGNGNTKVTASGDGAMAWGGSTGNYDYPLASGTLSTAWGVGSVASGPYATAFGDRTQATDENATAWGTRNIASGTDSTAFGIETLASGTRATAFGRETIAEGENSVAFGAFNKASSFAETVLGFSATTYVPGGAELGPTDRLFVIGNGDNSVTNTTGLGVWPDRNDAFVILKNGKTGIGFNNFETTTSNALLQVNGDILVDGLAGCSALTADSDGVLGCGSSGSFDLIVENSVPGFTAPFVTGDNAVGIGDSSEATGAYSFAAGILARASGDESVSLGSEARSIGLRSFAAGRQAESHGINSFALGQGTRALGENEFVVGSYNNYTGYTPAGNSTDRLFVVGNGVTSPGSNAFIILKNGKTGIGYTNFETTSAADLLQVNGAILQTNATGCALEADVDGTLICAASDENLKTDIHDISYGLETVLDLRPVEYLFKDSSFGEGNQVGFIAQEVEHLVPEVVKTGPAYKSLNYAHLVPVVVSAVKELNEKVSDMSLLSDSFGVQLKDSIRFWLQDTSNGIKNIFADRVQTKELCVGSRCITEAQFIQLLDANTIGTTIVIDQEETLSGEEDIDDQITPEENMDEEDLVIEEVIENEDQEVVSEEETESEVSPDTHSEVIDNP